MAVALIVAAGRGERLGSGRPKALVALGGRPMLEWSVHALRFVEQVDRIAVALPAARAGLMSRIRDDFCHDRMVSVEGWMLAETEARLCALVALLE